VRQRTPVDSPATITTDTWGSCPPAAAFDPAYIPAPSDAPDRVPAGGMNFFPRSRLTLAIANIVGCFIFSASGLAQDISDLVATPVSSTEVALSWKSPFAYGYRVSRRGPGGTDFAIGEPGQTSFRDRELEPDTDYTYTVVVSVPQARSTAILHATCHTPAWSDQDIGQVGVTGSVQRTGDVITIAGSGADIWGTADAFHFVDQPWTGDGTLIVRVDSVANTDSWAKAGIMFRESLAPGSRYVLAAMNPIGNAALLSRGNTDGPSEFGISVYTYTPQWLRLSRAGNTFQAYQSSDGVTWTLIGSTTVAMSASLYAGLAVTSHNAGTLCSAVFDGFNLSPSWDGSGGTLTHLTAVAASNGRIELSWQDETNHSAPYFLVELSRDNFRASAITFALSRTHQSIYGLDADTTYHLRVRPSNLDGLGLSSAIVSATTLPLPPGVTPAAPSSLSANAVSSSQVNLMWADNSDNESAFLIERSTDGVMFSQIASPFPNTNSTKITGLTANTTYYFRVRAIHQATDDDYQPVYSGYSNLAATTTSLTPVGTPYNVAQPQSMTPPLGMAGSYLATSADGGPNSYQWLRNGVAIPGATAARYSFNSPQPEDAGIYTAVITNAGGSVATEPAIVGLFMTQKVAGAAREVGSDIHHPNGNIYDQVLLEGTAASITADPGQVTRLSFVDLNDDIVQVEFSGAGTLTITLDNASGPAPAVKYNQPSVSYMKGHATIVVANTDETTNVAIFSVGRNNAVSQSLFRDRESYDGIADVATLAITNPSLPGRFGGIYSGDAHYFATHGVAGIFAPSAQFTGPVTASDVSASDSAFPMLWLGQANEISIAGGNLAQPNNRAVQIGMITHVRSVDGTTSGGKTLAAQTITGRLEQNGRDVTGALTSTSTP
jgi:hypothetical protein